MDKFSSLMNAIINAHESRVFISPINWYGDLLVFRKWINFDSLFSTIAHTGVQRYAIKLGYYELGYNEHMV